MAQSLLDRTRRRDHRRSEPSAWTTRLGQCTSGSASRRRPVWRVPNEIWQSAASSRRRSSRWASIRSGRIVFIAVVDRRDQAQAGGRRFVFDQDLTLGVRVVRVETVVLGHGRVPASRRSGDVRSVCPHRDDRMNSAGLFGSLSEPVAGFAARPCACPFSGVLPAEVPLHPRRFARAARSPEADARAPRRPSPRS